MTIYDKGLIRAMKQAYRDGGYDSEYGHVSDDSVTHWMPLPEPPKEEAK